MSKSFIRSPGKGFKDFNPNVGSNRGPTMKDLVEPFDFGTKKKYRAVRLVGEMYVIGLHKIKIKKKDGSVIPITKPCVAFDRKVGKQDQTKTKKCGYCQMGEQQHLQVKYFTNLIDRAAQEDKPRKAKEPSKKERKSGYLEMGSETWTPVRVLGMPPSLAKRVKEIDDRHLIKKDGKKKHYDIRDVRKGIDIEIKFDKDEQAANMYAASKSDDGPSALTDEELEYPIWDLTVLYPPESSEQSFKEAKSMGERAPDDIKKSKRKDSGDDSGDNSGSGDDSGDSGDSDDDRKKRKGKKSKRKDSGDSGDSDSGRKKKRSKRKDSDEEQTSADSDDDSASASEDDRKSKSNKGRSRDSDSDGDSGDKRSSKKSRGKHSSKSRSKDRKRKGRDDSGSGDSGSADEKDKDDLSSLDASDDD